MSIEHGFTPEKVVKSSVRENTQGTEQKEQERRRSERHELRDKNGDLICVAQVEYSDEEEKEYAETRGKPARKLKSFILEKEGKSVDILEVIRIRKPIRIFVSSQEKNFYFDMITNNLLVPPLDNPAGIAVALHEIGHAEQSGLAFFESMTELRKEFASIASSFTKINVFSKNIESGFARLERDYPELKPHFPPKETFTQLEELRVLADGIGELDDKIAGIQMGLDGRFSNLESYNKNAYIKLTQQDFDEMRLEFEQEIQKLMEAKNRLQQKVDANGETRDQLIERYEEAVKPLEQLLRMVEKMAERDATKRAFQLMQFVHREIGADLMSPQIDVPSQLASIFDKKDTCVESTARVVGDLQKFGGFSAKGALLAALGTYDAFDKVPIPTRERLIQMEQERWERQQKRSSN